MDKSVIHLYRPGGFEVPQVAVTIFVDESNVADLRHKECVSIVVEPGQHRIRMCPHSMQSGSGMLSLDAAERTIEINAVANDASYVAVKVPCFKGRLVASTRLLKEREAMRDLSKSKPW